MRFTRNYLLIEQHLSVVYELTNKYEKGKIISFKRSFLHFYIVSTRSESIRIRGEEYQKLTENWFLNT